MILQVNVQNGVNTVGTQAVEAAKTFAGNPGLLAGGIVLIIAGILVIIFLKRIIVNSVLGAIAWAIVNYVFQINLPFYPSLIVSVAFGLPGIGVMLLLRFLGVM